MKRKLLAILMAAAMLLPALSPGAAAAEFTFEKIPGKHGCDVFAYSEGAAGWLEHGLHGQGRIWGYTILYWLLWPGAKAVQGIRRHFTGQEHRCYMCALRAGDMPPNPLEKEGWILDRHDEFGGPALDETLWIPRYNEYRKPPGETDAHFIFRDGCLVLQIPDSSVGVSSLQTGAKDFLHGDSFDHSIPEDMKYTPQYGYFEIRAKTQEGSGIHCAFWGIGTKETPDRNAEIDVFEILGREERSLMWNLHGWNDPKLQAHDGANVQLDFKPSDGFHIYALEWTPERIKLYVDNRLTGTIEASPDYPFVFLLGIYENAGWTGDVDTGIAYPKEFAIDYFRAYKKN